MPFVITGHLRPGPDVQARLDALRPAHMDVVARMAQAGTMILGGGLLDREGGAWANMAVLATTDRQEAEAWAADHPFNRAGLWDRVEIAEIRLAPVFAQTQGG